jgi:hypothetical protein
MVLRPKITDYQDEIEQPIMGHQKLRKNKQYANLEHKLRMVVDLYIQGRALLQHSTIKQMLGCNWF